MSYDVLEPQAARLWRYSPDWSGSLNVRRSFVTDVLTSRNNKEQRRSIRAKPRFQIDYRRIVTGADLRDASHFLRAWQNKPTIIPDFVRYARTTAASILGAQTLTIAPLPAFVKIGQPLVLCGSGSTLRLRVLVTGIAGSTITLAAPLQQAWPLGSIVRPAFFGLLDGSIRTKRETTGSGELNVQMACYAGAAAPRALGVAGPMLGAREIFTADPDFASPPSFTYLWPVEQIDYDRGRTAEFRPVDMSQMAIENDFAGLSFADAEKLEQFFERMQGRLHAFYMPTGEKDFELASAADAAATAFLSTGTAIADDFGLIDYATTELAVCVYLKSGTRIYRRITDIDSTGANSRITVAAAWGSALSTATVARISLMPLWRFASDEMTTSWQTPLTARTRLTFQSVRQ